MKDLDLNLLLVLVALHRSRSVSKAAAELELSQSATSLALGRLRKTFGDPLFVRSRSGMLPTTRCTELAEVADKAISNFSSHALARPAFDPTSSHRDFVVTMVDVGELHFLPQLLAYLHLEAPHCNLRCETFVASDVASALEDGRCDLALGLFPNLDRATLRARHLSTHSLVCLVRADHPQVRSSRLSLRQFLELSHVVVHPTGLSHDVLFEAKLQEMGCSRRIQLMTAHFLSVPSIIAATDMIVTVPRPIADYYGRIENLRMVEPPIDVETFPVRMFWHSRLDMDPAVSWLRDSVLHLFGTDDDKVRRGTSVRTARQV